jgi:hypothetical protein
MRGGGGERGVTEAVKQARGTQVVRLRAFVSADRCRG